MLTAAFATSRSLFVSARRLSLTRTMASAAASAKEAGAFIDFINASPSPYHAVAECEQRLKDAGFAKLSEREVWDVKPGGKYYATRNQSAVVAFAVGGKYVPGNAFAIAAAHTDSPCLRVKPISTLKKAGYLSVGVETYGGGLWYSWLDRDLSIAGRAIVEKAPAVAGGAPTFESRLVRVSKPILRIPSLAIHLNREVNSEGLKLNTETHLAPILATAVKDQLNAPPPAAAAAAAAAPASADAPAAGGAGASAAAAPAPTGALTRHHSSLVHLLARELGCEPEAIHDFDLCLYDTQPSAIGGLHDEFIFSARLDNLMMTYTTLAGLLNSTADAAAGGDAAGAAAGGAGVGAAAASTAPLPLSEDGTIRVMAAFDHEEVGSSSVPGAASTLLEDIVRRLCPDAALQPVALRKSILVSVDMAHAVHPNYPHLHEENHRPAMHAGIVIKCNGNQRYATTSTTGFMFRRLAEEARVPVQTFVVRQDMGCGSTIGPIVATRLGLRTVDVGVPQLSMHSIREMAGVDDCASAVKFFGHFYGRFAAVDESIVGSD